MKYKWNNRGHDGIILFGKQDVFTDRDYWSSWILTIKNVTDFLKIKSLNLMNDPHVKVLN